LIQQAEKKVFTGARYFFKYLYFLILGLALCSCAPKQVIIPQSFSTLQSSGIKDEAPLPKTSYTRDVWGPGLTLRIVSEKDIDTAVKRHPELTRRMCFEILGRLNSKSHLYIPDDIKAKRKLRIPKDFNAYKNWTPMPLGIHEVSEAPKFILIIKNIPFIGWYEKGRLVGDAQVSIGKLPAWTKAGFYRVQEKDVDHFSQSYKNVYGQPAPMPFALRIYGHVWIHGGDIQGGYLSHGCVNLPLDPAEQLFNWAEIGTAVLVVESLKSLEKDLQKYSKVLFPDKTVQVGKKQAVRPSPPGPKPQDSKQLDGATQLEERGK
jgi:hypothetical protein